MDSKKAQRVSEENPDMYGNLKSRSLLQQRWQTNFLLGELQTQSQGVLRTGRIAQAGAMSPTATTKKRVVSTIILHLVVEVAKRGRTTMPGRVFPGSQPMSCWGVTTIVI
jgi:hypothetical protein